MAKEKEVKYLSVKVGDDAVDICRQAAALERKTLAEFMTEVLREYGMKRLKAASRRIAKEDDE